jgi:hypothetical protein
LVKFIDVPAGYMKYAQHGAVSCCNKQYKAQ